MSVSDRVGTYIENLLSKYNYEHLCTFDVVHGLPVEGSTKYFEYIVVLYFDPNQTSMIESKYSQYIKKCEFEIKTNILEYLGKEVDVVSKKIPEICIKDN